MAIFHLHMQTISRSDGRSAVAAAAYRAAARLTAPDGTAYDFRRKRGVVGSKIFVPSGYPAIERQGLWCSAERAEKRKNSTLAREIDVAIPIELSMDERFKLTAAFCRWLADEYQVAVDCSIHRKDRKDVQENPHGHMLFTTRRYQLDGRLGEKARELDELKTRKQHLLHIREKWADLCNEYLQPYARTVDHRSYKDQCIEQVPQIHIGAAAAEMERRGLATERGNINREILASNAEKLQIDKEILDEQQQLARMGSELCAGSTEAGTAQDRPICTEGGDRGIEYGLGQGAGNHGFGQQGTFGNQSADFEHEHGRSSPFPIREGFGGSSGNIGRGACAIEDGCANAASASKVDERNAARLAIVEKMRTDISRNAKELRYSLHEFLHAKNARFIRERHRYARVRKFANICNKNAQLCESIGYEILSAVGRFDAKYIAKRGNIHRKRIRSKKREMELKDRLFRFVETSYAIVNESLNMVDYTNDMNLHRQLSCVRDNAKYLNGEDESGEDRMDM